MGAPKGNQNAARPHRLFENQLRAAVAKEDYKALRLIAEKAVAKAKAGEPWAVQFVAERLDGKVKQVIVGDEDEPLMVKIVQRLVIGE